MADELVLLKRVAKVYLRAFDPTARDRGNPSQAVQALLGAVSRSTAARRIREARDAGLIPEGKSSLAVLGPHHPLTARWSSGVHGKSFLLCHECKTPWPCKKAR